MTKADCFNKSVVENLLDWFDIQVKDHVVIHSHLEEKCKDQFELIVTCYVKINLYNIQEHTDSY